MTTRTLGENGFRWFIGTVVDRKTDPLKLGRVKVRIFSVHDDPATTPDSELPWATIINPPQSASTNQIGIAPLGILEGSTVVGFFADGAEGQLPMILGTIAGIPGNDTAKHDVAKLAREENDLVESKSTAKQTGTLVTEPDSAFNAKYPFNKVFKTEKGHVLEFDDTDGHERIHMYHKAGTYTEIDSEGTRVDKIIGDNYTVIVRNNNTLIGTDCIVEVVGKVIVLVNGTASVRVDGDCSMSAGGLFTISSDKKLVLKAPQIHFNPDTVGTITSTDTVPSPTGTGKTKYAGFVQPNITKSRYGG
jgi:hypothetical protein